MRWWVLAVIAAAGCYAPEIATNVPCSADRTCPANQTCVDGLCRGAGTPTIDAPGSLGDADGDASPDAPAGACAGGDGTCLVACVATDPDCQTTCGDGTCVGNAGELCTSCPADCEVTTPVCGNGACDAGEAPDCFADCGPVPWTWAADEATLLGLINDARTIGKACPNGTSLTRPALQDEPAMRPATREWVWELSHHDYFAAGGRSCNDRTATERMAASGGYDAYLVNRSSPTIQTVFDNWMTSASSCGILMSTAQTKISVSVAMDVKRSYLVVLR